MFDLFSTVTLNLVDLTITGGLAAAGEDGGGIRNDDGTLSITTCTISDNTAEGSGGGIYSGGSGAQFDLTDSTVSDNTATSAGGAGGGVYTYYGTAAIQRSTLAANASIIGGGLAVASTDVTITNSTISGNAADTGGGIANASGTLTVAFSTIADNAADDGGGFAQLGGSSDVENTIIAQNSATTSDPDTGGGFTSSGNNLIGDVGSATGFTHGTSGDQVGDSASPLDPMLGPLASGGGPTSTHALLPGSPAIDMGNNTSALSTDQRGMTRILDGDDSGTATVDIGAYELAFADFYVDSLVDAVDANPGDGVSDDGSGRSTLRAAVMEANATAGANVILLGVGTYTLRLPGHGEDAAATGDLDVTQNLTIVGAGVGETIIDGGEIDRVFHVFSGITLTLDGVTVTGGNTSTTGDGGGIFNDDGGLALGDVVVTGNRSTGPDGVYISGGSLTVTGESVIADGLAMLFRNDLTVDGSGAVLTVEGTAAINAVDLFASGGGVLWMPTVQTRTGHGSYSTIRASGAGSLIGLPGVREFFGDTNTYWTTVEALSGGVVSLSSATLIGKTGPAGNATRLRAEGADSRIDLASLTETRDLWLTVVGAGVIDAPVVETLTESSFYTSAGAQLDLSSATSYAGGWQYDTIQASGAGSLIDLSGLTTFNGATNTYWSKVEALDGGRIDLSGTVSVGVTGVGGNWSRLTANGAGSRIELTSLTETARSVADRGGAGVIDVPVVETLTESSFYTSAGGQLDLSSATSYAGGWQYDTIQASGAGSLIDLSGLTTFSGATNTYWSKINALDGGTLDFSSLLTVGVTGSSDNQTRMIASNTGSQITLPALTEIVRCHLTAQNGGAVSVPLLQTITTSTLTATGQDLTLSSLETMLNSNLYATSGGRLLLPAATSYAIDLGVVTIEADGEGSEIDLSTLTTLEGGVVAMSYGPHYAITVNAIGGGKVDFSQVASVLKQVFLRSQGADSGGTPSEIDLSSLTEIDGGGGYAELSATGAGIIRVPNLVTVADTSLLARSGAELTLPSCHQLRHRPRRDHHRSRRRGKRDRSLDGDRGRRRPGSRIVWAVLRHYAQCTGRRQSRSLAGHVHFQAGLSDGGWFGLDRDGQPYRPVVAGVSGRFDRRAHVVRRNRRRRNRFRFRRRHRRQCHGPGCEWRHNLRRDHRDSGHGGHLRVGNDSGQRDQRRFSSARR